MEYKKSKPTYGMLDGRYTTFYQYDFPRATRTRGKFLPQGTVRLREFLYSDGKHGQLVQITLISPEEVKTVSEQRVLVNKILELNREDKKFHEGELTSQELSGEIREYAGKKLICLNEILAEQEKIGLFASARRVKDSRMRQRRTRNWKIRFRVGLGVGVFVLGLLGGALLQEYGLFDLGENAFYQNYVLTSWTALVDLFHKIFR